MREGREKPSSAFSSPNSSSSLGTWQQPQQLARVAAVSWLARFHSNSSSRKSLALSRPLSMAFTPLYWGWSLYCWSGGCLAFGKRSPLSGWVVDGSSSSLLALCMHVGLLLFLPNPKPGSLLSCFRNERRTAYKTGKGVLSPQNRSSYSHAIFFKAPSITFCLCDYFVRAIQGAPHSSEKQ